jgi:hypothetical protein
MFTVILILGLFFLNKEKAASQKHQEFVEESREGSRNPDICSRLTVLKGTEATSFLPRGKGNRKLTPATTEN